MTWIVSTEIINGAGICLGEELIGEDYTPFVRASLGATSSGSGTGYIVFDSYQGNYNPSGRSYYTHRYSFDLINLLEDYIRRVYNLSDDIELDIDYEWVWGSFWNTSKNRGTQQTFETEAEALEYVGSLGNPDPLFQAPYRDGNRLFRVDWRQEIDGVFVSRNVELNHTGDPVSLYTINDFINYFALLFGITPEEIPVEYTLNISDLSVPKPSYDCEPYIKATVIDIDGPGDTIEIDIDFTGSSIGDVTVTTIDGDPPSTSLENGAGSVTISDSGNINMRNDGGTFFLNEFGNVGFYASGDASLTAESQVQLGSGGTTFNVDSNGLNMRDSTGTVSFTADELSRLKDLLS